ncbi:hypothetical protein YB2330_001050 [Saitoella coloradoensis]
MGPPPPIPVKRVGGLSAGPTPIGSPERSTASKPHPLNLTNKPKPAPPGLPQLYVQPSTPDAANPTFKIDPPLTPQREDAPAPAAPAAPVARPPPPGSPRLHAVDIPGAAGKKVPPPPPSPRAKATAPKSTPGYFDLSTSPSRADTPTQKPAAPPSRRGSAVPPPPPVGLEHIDSKEKERKAAPPPPPASRPSTELRRKGSDEAHNPTPIGGRSPFASPPTRSPFTSPPVSEETEEQEPPPKSLRKGTLGLGLGMEFPEPPRHQALLAQKSGEDSAPAPASASKTKRPTPELPAREAAGGGREVLVGVGGSTLPKTAAWTLPPPPVHKDVAERRAGSVSGEVKRPNLPAPTASTASGTGTNVRPPLPAPTAPNASASHNGGGGIPPPHPPETRRSMDPKPSQEGARPHLPSRPRSAEKSATQQQFPNTVPRRSVDAARAMPPIPSEGFTPGGGSLFPPPPKRMSTSGPLSGLPPPMRKSVDAGAVGGYKSPSLSAQGSAPGSPALRQVSTGSITPAPSSSTMPEYDEDGSDEVEAVEPAAAVVEKGKGGENYPDASASNRRPPVFATGAKEVQCRMESKVHAISGVYACVASGNVVKVFDTVSGECVYSSVFGDYKITAACFKPCQGGEDWQFLWVGTKDGTLLEIDLSHSTVQEARVGHAGAITFIVRCGGEMWSIDETGTLLVWRPEAGAGTILLGSKTKMWKVATRQTMALVVGDELWLGCHRSANVYRPTYDGNVPFNVSAKAIMPSKPLGIINCGALLPQEPDKVYLGHEDGKIGVYSRSQLACVEIIDVSSYKLTAMAAVRNQIWVGFATGMVYVYEMDSKPWKVLKDWKAHKQAVSSLIADPETANEKRGFQVVSLGLDNSLKMWDALLTLDWQERQMYARNHEYCDFRDIRVQICTWNAGASKPENLDRDPEDAAFLENVLNSGNSPEIIVFGFQELVDLEDKKLTAKTLLKSRKKDSGQLQENISHRYRLWQERLAQSVKFHMAPENPYTLVHSANLVGLFTCIFVKASESAAVKHLSATTVKTGLGGLHGNKGALVLRFVLDDTSFCFVNCHLAAGQSHTAQRNSHMSEILEQAALPAEVYDPAAISNNFVGGGDGSMVLDHDCCFINGDLNYRIGGLSRENAIDRIKRGDIEKLLEYDQLTVERRKNRALRLRAFVEPPIKFAPTYKYDVGTDNYDSSEKKRVPAWCDRILYRTVSSKITTLNYDRFTVRVSDHRPVVGLFKARVKTVKEARKEDVWASVVSTASKARLQALDEVKLQWIMKRFSVTELEARAALDEDGWVARNTALRFK